MEICGHKPDAISRYVQDGLGPTRTNIVAIKICSQLLLDIANNWDFIILRPPYRYVWAKYKFCKI